MRDITSYSDYTMGWVTKESWFNILQQQDTSPFLKAVRYALMPTQNLITRG
jgi:hypothetical protein